MGPPVQCSMTSITRREQETENGEVDGAFCSDLLTLDLQICRFLFIGDIEANKPTTLEVMQAFFRKKEGEVWQTESNNQKPALRVFG